MKARSCVAEEGGRYQKHPLTNRLTRLVRTYLCLQLVHDSVVLFLLRFLLIDVADVAPGSSLSAWLGERSFI